MEIEPILDALRSLADPSVVDSMDRFAVRPATIRLGVSIPSLRRLARRTGHDHAMAEALWQSGFHEAQILATLIDEPAAVTEEQRVRAISIHSMIPQIDAIPLREKSRESTDQGLVVRNQGVAAFGETARHHQSVRSGKTGCRANPRGAVGDVEIGRYELKVGEITQKRPHLRRHARIRLVRTYQHLKCADRGIVPNERIVRIGQALEDVACQWVHRITRHLKSVIADVSSSTVRLPTSA